MSGYATKVTRPCPPSCNRSSEVTESHENFEHDELFITFLFYNVLCKNNVIIFFIRTSKRSLVQMKLFVRSSISCFEAN